MHRKKYFTLLPPALILTLVAIYFLPTEAINYTLIIPLLFWVAYYGWIYIEKKFYSNGAEKE
jgi:hypothetical protein